MNWERYRQYLYYNRQLGLMVDISRVNFTEESLQQIEPLFHKAWQDMCALEKGALANPDEGRMVGHYWLRNPELAPKKEIAAAIRETIRRIKDFAQGIHRGQIMSPTGKQFRNILLMGIGGSALGPQFVTAALETAKPRMNIFFLDNTDPDGFDMVLARLKGRLAETLALVISKSGSTAETRNALLEVRNAYQREGLNFAAHSVAVTQEGSFLDRQAVEEGWLARFPMWDWVGGRTSETSAVGLLPAALQGFKIDDLLHGAAACDEATRQPELRKNPAALLAAMWWKVTGGRDGTDLVILPYKDRLSLLAKYLQQLIMESLGKAMDLDGQVVNQGIAVFGNKGSTDQHSYMQQLLDGPANILVTFIEVLRDRSKPSLQVEKDVTSGDYLTAFLQGTRKALTERGKDSITITIPEINAYTIGVLIALFERTVGLYAGMCNINAYHQPAVEAGKKGAQFFLNLQRKVLAFLRDSHGSAAALTAEEIARIIKEEKETELIFKILEHAGHNPDHGVKRYPAELIYNTRYAIKE